MEKKIFTLGLSSDLVISQDVIKQIAEITMKVAPFTKNKVVGILSTNHREANTCAEVMRQLLKVGVKLKAKSFPSGDTFYYQGESSDFFKYPQWKEFITSELSYYDVLILVLKDPKRYAPNEIKSQYSGFTFGEEIILQPLW